MTNLPSSILNIFAIFAPLFSRPIYRNAMLLFMGHIITKGRRTVTDILRSILLNNEKNFSKFHWVLSHAKWNCLHGSQILFKYLLTLIPNQEIFIVIDSTLERRKGPKIQGLGTHRDSKRSSKNKKVLSIGLNWLVCGIRLKLPFCTNSWVLPFLSILMKPEKPLSSSKNYKDLNRKSRHKKITEWAFQVMCLARRWAGKSKKITIVADSAFSCFKLAYAYSKFGVGLITRLRLDARLYDFIPQNSKRKRVVGNVLPKLSVLAKKDISEWSTVIVKWYGGEEKKLYVQYGKCLWYYVGFTPVAIQWILIKESPNSEPVALLSTDLSHTTKVLIEAFIGRWGIEVTFEEARRHLGIETQRQWSDQAIQRTTPIIFASFSIVIAMGLKLSEDRNEKIEPQKTSWYQKTEVTFSDVLAYVRRPILKDKYNSLVNKKGDRKEKYIDDLIMEAAAA